MEPCSNSETGNFWDLVKVQTTLSHSGGSPIDVLWERLLVDIPTGWKTAVCDPNQCYAPASDEPLGPGAVLIPFAMAGGSSISGDQFYVQFQPNGIPGTGNVRLNVYESGNPNNSSLCSFEFTALATGIDDPGTTSVGFYPNPARTEMKVTAGESRVRVVEIYSVVGKLVNRIDLGMEKSTFQLDVSGLKEGMYFARMLNNNNLLVESKRFSKVN